MMIVCAGHSERIAYAVPIGVGLIEASIGLTKLCLKEYVKSIIFIGSAGAYDFNIPLLSLCVSFRATQIESGFLAGMCYTPLDNAINVSQETFREKTTNMRDVMVNSSNYITTDSAISSAMYGAGMSIENMEFFSVLQVAREFNIPACGIFCITNYCDIHAHRDFLAHHAAAKYALEQFIHTKNL